MSKYNKPTTFEHAKGPRATRIVATVEEGEPELTSFVRHWACQLDPTFREAARVVPGNEANGTTMTAYRSS